MTQLYCFILRMNQVYVTWYINWARLLVLGLVPFTAISLLNTRIYIAIRRGEYFAGNVDEQGFDQSIKILLAKYSPLRSEGDGRVGGEGRTGTG